MNTIKLTQTNVKHIGRTVFFDDTLWMILSGSGIAFDFTGKKLSVSVCAREASLLPDNEENYARIAIYINGVKAIDDCIKEAQKDYVLFDDNQPQTAQITIIKLSECAMSMCGIKCLYSDALDVSAAPKKPHKIEIIGDSITCGYGVDDENCEHHFKTSTEDVTKSYSYKTAMALNADYSMFSTSGHGIISGYTDDLSVKHTDQLIPERYTTYGLCYDTFDGKLKTTDISWDFSRFQPDAIIINLGTNDDSYCQDIAERQIEYKDEYIKFLKKVRLHNPSAHIFCVLGLMGNRLFPMVCKACEEYSKETGDTKLSTFELPEQDGNIGYVADYHPMECFHEQASRVLVPFIKETMGWQ